MNDRDALQHALNATLAGHHHRATPPSFCVTSPTLSGIVDVDMIFQAGVEYCCAEAGCHLDLTDPRVWARLRAHLNQLLDATPPRLTIRLRIVVEQGARLVTLRSVGVPIESAAYTAQLDPALEPAP